MASIAGNTLGVALFITALVALFTLLGAFFGALDKTLGFFTNFPWRPKPENPLTVQQLIAIMAQPKLNLSNAECQAIGGALVGLRRSAYLLAALLFLTWAIILGIVWWSVPTTRYPDKLALTIVEPVDLKADWLKQGVNLTSNIFSWTEEGEQNKRAGHIKDFLLVRAQSEAFGQKTGGYPTTPFRGVVRSNSYGFSGTVLLVHVADGLAYYRTLQQVESQGALTFDLPVSGPTDYLLVVGRLSSKTEVVPADLRDVLTLEVQTK